jgi:hypothetical protein
LNDWAVNRIQQLEKALLDIHDLTYRNHAIATPVREKIQKIIIVDANIDPNRREN